MRVAIRYEKWEDGTLRLLWEDTTTGDRWYEIVCVDGVPVH